MWWKESYNKLKKEGYIFHNTNYDNKDRFINFGFGNKKVKDIERMVNTIRTEIKKLHKDERINLIIPIENKGKIIYLGLFNLFEKKFKYIGSKDIKKEDVYKKNVILFDDSINHGRTIKRNIKKILKWNPTKIIIYSIIARKDTLKKLEEHFQSNKNIEFYFYDRSPKAIFSIVCTSTIFPLMEYLGFPILHSLYTVGVIRTEEQFMNLYRNIIWNKNSPTSILSPSTIEKSIMLKGKIDYSGFFDQKYMPDETTFSCKEIELKFVITQYAPDFTVFSFQPKIDFTYFNIYKDPCKNKKLFSSCYKEKYISEKTCPDCVLHHLLADVNEHVYTICSKIVDTDDLLTNNSIMLE